MLQSKLLSKTRHHPPKDEQSQNARLLIQAGFVHKEMAGVYSYLPLGKMVMENIISIIREEMNSVGGQEVSMTALQQSTLWEKTGRWSDEVVDDWFKTDLKNGTTLSLAFTHEEPLTELVSHHVSSYKDLPIYAYQFQTKFRNELRAKSGIMRGKEFLMKDLYSFSRNREEHLAFYEKMKEVYMRIFDRVGLGDRTHLTMSTGGSFSKYSFEFQTITDAGEDSILYDEEKGVAINKDDYSRELLDDFGLKEEECNFKEARAVEVGDIYTLGDKYSKALGLTYKDENGEEQFVFMGSYGIGVPRVMGAVVEVHADDKGLVWPLSIAPFSVHLVRIGDTEGVVHTADDLYSSMEENGVSVLYDDRKASVGEKFSNADLIGIPIRVVVGEKGVAAGEVEISDRATGKVSTVDEAQVIDQVRRIITTK